MEIDDFVVIEKSAPGTGRIVPPTMVRVSRSGITLGKEVVAVLKRTGRFVRIEYSPKHEALRLSGIDDPHQGYLMKYDKTGSANCSLPRKFQLLHVPTGEYYPMGNEAIPFNLTIYKLTKRTVK